MRTITPELAAQVRRAQANTVDGLLRRAVSTHAERTAVRYRDRAWTYRELDAAVTAAARRLAAAGIDRGDRVAVYGANSDVYLILFLVCARGGFVHVPVNFALKGEELAHLLRDSGARLLIADAELLPVVAQVCTAGGDLGDVVLWRIDDAPLPDRAPPVVADAPESR